MLVPKQDGHQISEKSVASAAASGTEVSEEESGQNYYFDSHLIGAYMLLFQTSSEHLSFYMQMPSEFFQMPTRFPLMDFFDGISTKMLKAYS